MCCVNGGFKLLWREPLKDAQSGCVLVDIAVSILFVSWCTNTSGRSFNS